jgi:hypothetical protein
MQTGMDLDSVLLNLVICNAGRPQLDFIRDYTFL